MKKYLSLISKLNSFNKLSVNSIKNSLLLSKYPLVNTNMLSFASKTKKVSDSEATTTTTKSLKKISPKKETKKEKSSSSSSASDEEETKKTKSKSTPKQPTSKKTTTKATTSTATPTAATTTKTASTNSKDNTSVAKTKKTAQTVNPTTNKSKNFEVDFKNNPQNIGKVTLDYPINLNSFPKCSGKFDDPYQDYINSNRLSTETKNIIFADQASNCRNYAPLPVVLAEGHGSVVEDVDGFRYIDCLLGYSAINMGHGNAKIHTAMVEQMSKLYMTSRAFYNNKLYEAAKLITEIFQKDKVLFMNSGVEAGETAVKMARRWGYEVKKIKDNEAKIVFVKNNFWGRTITACATSDDPSRYKGFGPYDRENFYLIDYNNLEAVEETFKNDSNICAIFLEPIQGEAGIIIPDNNYLKGVYELCKKYNVLLIDDEVQAGLGRSGKLLACEHSLGADIKPDIILLAKSLSNGYYPISAVLANSEIVDLIKPGEHGSTFSANPLAMNILIASLKELISEDGKIIKNSSVQGSRLAYLIYSLNSPLIKEVRGRGLFIGVEFHQDIPIKVSDIALLLMERGLLTKQTHSTCLRLTPALNIGNEEVFAIYHIFKSVVDSLAAQLKYSNGNQTVADFIVTMNIKNEMDDYILSSPRVEYKTKNNKQEKYKLSLLSPINIVDEEVNLKKKEKVINMKDNLNEINLGNDEIIDLNQLKNRNKSNNRISEVSEEEFLFIDKENDNEDLLKDPLGQILRNQKI